VVPDLLSLARRSVAVAGAGGGGIGTATCRMVAAAGARVVAVDVDAARLEQAVAAVRDEGGEVAPVVADLRDEGAVAHALAVADERGDLAGLVHVAGGMAPQQWARVTELDPGAFDDVVALNLRAPFLTLRGFGARLAERGRGSIVVVASISGIESMPYGAPYSAAKAGVMALVRTAAVELGPAGVRVNAIAPGTVRTAKNAAGRPSDDTPAERAAIPLGRRGTPADIAGAALYLVSDLAAFVSGHTLVVDGGSSARPSYLDDDDLPVFVHDAELRARLRPKGVPT